MIVSSASRVATTTDGKPPVALRSLYMIRSYNFLFLSLCLFLIRAEISNVTIGNTVVTSSPTDKHRIEGIVSLHTAQLQAISESESVSAWVIFRY